MSEQFEQALSLNSTVLRGSAFRHFCNEKWYEHKDEILAWTGNQVGYDAKYYFRKHRWLLKRMFIEESQNAS